MIEDKNLVAFDGNMASYGYWVETPIDVKPMVTYDANAFEVTEEGFKTEILTYKDNGMVTTQLPENGGLTVRFSYNNRSGEMQKAQIYMAFYSDNRLFNVTDVFKGDIQFGEDGYKLYKPNDIPTGTDRIKLCVWDGAGNLKSVSNAIELLPSQATAEEKQERK